jgi:molecular chaperone GrpE
VDDLTKLVEQVAALAAELATLRTELARGHDRAAAREQIIDRLHGENERLRAGERLLLLRPLLTDLQRLRHELLRESCRLPEDLTAERAGELLRSYAHNLELTLERGGVRVVEPDVGATFDATTQRVTGTVPTDEPTRDATVAEVVVDGYFDVEANRVVQAATVRVHQFVGVAD